MPAKKFDRLHGNLSQNRQKAVMATCICFLTAFTERIQLTNIQANCWVGQMHCGLSSQNFGWTNPARPPSPLPSALPV